MLLPTTAVGLRWKSFKRLLRWVQGEKDLSRTFFFFYSITHKWNPVLFFSLHHILFFALIRRAYLLLTFLRKVEAFKQHPPCQHAPHNPHLPHHYSYCHSLYGYARCSFYFNWQLEVVSEVVSLISCWGDLFPLFSSCRILTHVTAAWCQ